MKVCFCVLWMPTIIHKDFDQPLKTESDIFDISDRVDIKDNNSRLFAKLTLTDDKNIIIDLYHTNKIEDKIKGQTIILKYIENRHNGLFKYSIDFDDSKSNIIWDSENKELNFPCSFYHKIKEFYHSHDYHKIDDGDSMLRPYISFNNVNLTENNNKALIHYLNQYESKFINGFEFISQAFSVLIEKNQLSYLEMSLTSRSKHHSFYKLASRIKGDKTYYNSLYKSCYNTDYKIDTSSENKKECRRQIINIENIIDSINIMEERVNNKFSIFNYKLSFWIAVTAIVISIGTFIISCNISEESGKELENRLDSNTKSLRKDIANQHNDFIILKKLTNHEKNNI